MPVSKKIAIISLVVICSGLILGAVVYTVGNFQDAISNPTPTSAPTPEPQQVPTAPLPESGSSIVVPDDYPNVSAAIDHAPEGATIYLRNGTYEGPINQTVVIDKTLSMVGESTESTIINLYPAYNVTWMWATPFFSYSDAITITANAFRLLNLTLTIANPGGYISATGNQTQIIGNNIQTSPSTGVTLQGSYCNITDNVIGGRIELNGSFSKVDRNSLSAIYIYGCSNIIKNNVCEHIDLSNSTENIVSGNRVTTSSRSFSGISLTNSNNNLFYRNQVSGFSSGFRLWFSSGNTITANTIADSLQAAINLGSSSNNTIYLNNFIDNPSWIHGYVYDQYSDPNARGAVPNMTVSTNFWDNGKEGNYWGSYNGSDINGNFQGGYNGSDVNADGIGDTPYVINANNQDNFPLMTPIDIQGVSIEL